MMTAQELLTHIESSVKTFTNCKLRGAGVAYHYTNHFAAIEARGGFLGAPIDSNLDKTQYKILSDPAAHDPGVVFAYENESDTREEGFGCDIVRIEFSAAVQALHSQEAELDRMSGETSTPHTILILNTDITGYRKIEESQVLPGPTTPSPTPPTAPPHSTP
jgi:hypothetical protein